MGFKKKCVYVCPCPVINSRRAVTGVVLEALNDQTTHKRFPNVKRLQVLQCC